MTSKILRALIVPALPLALACQGESLEGDSQLGQTSATLSAACPAPALGTAGICDLGGGNLEFRVTLPSGQAQVEVFARKNGVQDVAVTITGSETSLGNGASTYALAVGGYASGNVVEYRFYSAQNGVQTFTPGPSAGAWATYTVGSTQPESSSVVQLPVTKDASLIYSSYATGPSATRNFGSANTVDVAGYHHDSRGLFGYSLAAVSSAEVEHAELVIPAVTGVAGSLGRFTLAKVQSSTSWAESTVTWMSTPAATVFGTFEVDTTQVNRLDVTDLVAEAVANGETEISFLLEDVQNNLFIDAKEKAGGQPTYLEVEIVE